MLILYIIGFSVVIQTATIILALGLIKITGGRLSWILISASIIGIETRRCITLFQAISGETASYSPAFELVGLITSALMLAGIAGISPLFMAVKEAEGKKEPRFKPSGCAGKNKDIKRDSAYMRLLQKNPGRPGLLEPGRVIRQGPFRGGVQPQYLSGLSKKALSGLFQGRPAFPVNLPTPASLFLPII